MSTWIGPLAFAGLVVAFIATAVRLCNGISELRSQPPPQDCDETT